jgi:hypothetical protein
VIAVALECKAHPTYKAVRPPKSCATCRTLWDVVTYYRAPNVFVNTKIVRARRLRNVSVVPNA